MHLMADSSLGNAILYAQLDASNLNSGLSSSQSKTEQFMASVQQAVANSSSAVLQATQRLAQTYATATQQKVKELLDFETRESTRAKSEFQAGLLSADKYQKALMENLEALELTRQSLKKTDSAYLEVTNRMGGLVRELERLENQFRQAEPVAKTFTARLQDLANLSVAGFALNEVGQRVMALGRDLGDMAGEADQAQKDFLVLQNTVKSFGVSAEEANQVVNSLANKFNVAREDVQGYVTQLIRAELPLNIIEQTLTATGASALSAGRTLKQGFDNGATAVITLSSELLNSIGVVTNFSTSIQKYAKENNVATTSLTDQQKSLIGALGIIKETKVEVDSLSQLMSKYTVAQGNAEKATAAMRREIGAAAMPAVMAFYGTVSTASDVLGGFFRDLREGDGVIRGITTSVTLLAGAMAFNGLGGAAGLAAAMMTAKAVAASAASSIAASFSPVGVIGIAIIALTGLLSGLIAEFTRAQEMAMKDTATRSQGISTDASTAQLRAERQRMFDDLKKYRAELEKLRAAEKETQTIYPNFVDPKIAQLQQEIKLTETLLQRQEKLIAAAKTREAAPKTSNNTASGSPVPTEAELSRARELVKIYENAKTATEIAKAAEALDKFSKSSDSARAALTAVREASTRAEAAARDATQKTAEAERIRQQKVRESEQAYRDLVSAIGGANQQQATLSKMYELGLVTANEYRAGVQKLIAEIAKLASSGKLNTDDLNAARIVVKELQNQLESFNRVTLVSRETLKSAFDAGVLSTKEYGAGLQKLLDAAMQQINSGKLTEEQLLRTRVQAREYRAELEALSRSTLEVTTLQDRMTATMEGGRTLQSALAAAYQASAINAEQYRSGLRLVIAELENVLKTTKPTGLAYLELVTQIAQARGALNELNAVAEKTATTFDATNPVLEEVSKVLGETSSALGLYGQALEAGLISQEGYTANLLEYREALEQLSNEVTANSPEWIKLQLEIKKVDIAIQNAGATSSQAAEQVGSVTEYLSGLSQEAQKAANDINIYKDALGLGLITQEQYIESINFAIASLEIERQALIDNGENTLALDVKIRQLQLTLAGLGDTANQAAEQVGSVGEYLSGLSQEASKAVSDINTYKDALELNLITQDQYVESINFAIAALEIERQALIDNGESTLKLDVKIRQLQLTLAGLGDAANQAAGQVGSVGEYLSGLSNEAQKATNDINTYKDALGLGLITQDQYVESINFAIASLEIEKQALIDNGESTLALDVKIRQLQLTLAGLGDTANQAAEQVGSVTEYLSGLSQEAQKAANDINIYKDALALGLITQEQYIESINFAIAALEIERQALDENGESTLAVQVKIRQLQLTLAGLGDTANQAAEQVGSVTEYLSGLSQEASKASDELEVFQKQFEAGMIPQEKLAQMFEFAIAMLEIERQALIDNGESTAALDLKIFQLTQRLGLLGVKAGEVSVEVRDMGQWNWLETLDKQAKAAMDEFNLLSSAYSNNLINLDELQVGLVNAQEWLIKQRDAAAAAGQSTLVYDLALRQLTETWFKLTTKPTTNAEGIFTPFALEDYANASAQALTAFETMQGAYREGVRTQEDLDTAYRGALVALNAQREAMLSAGQDVTALDVKIKQLTSSYRGLVISAVDYAEITKIPTWDFGKNQLSAAEKTLSDFGSRLSLISNLVGQGLLSPTVASSALEFQLSQVQAKIEDARKAGQEVGDLLLQVQLLQAQIDNFKKTPETIVSDAMSALAAAQGQGQSSYQQEIARYEALAKKYPEVAQALQAVIAGYRELQETLEQNQAAQKAIDETQLLRQELEANIITQEQYIEAVNAQIAQLENLATQEGVSEEQSRRYRLEVAKLKLELASLNPEFARLYKQLQELSSALARGGTSGTKFLSILVDGVSSAIDAASKGKWNDAIRIAGQALADGIRAWDDPVAKAMGNVVETATNVLTRAASGDWIGAAVGLVTGIINAISDALNYAQKAQEDFDKAVKETNLKFANGADFVKQNTVLKNGFLGIPYNEVQTITDKFGLTLAQSIESGLSSGISNGFKKAITTGNMADFKTALREQVADAFGDTFTQVLYEKLINEGVLGEAIKKVVDAVQTDDPNDDVAAYAALDAALLKAEQVANRVLPSAQNAYNRYTPNPDDPNRIADELVRKALDAVDAANRTQDTADDVAAMKSLEEAIRQANNLRNQTASNNATNFNLPPQLQYALQPQLMETFDRFGQSLAVFDTGTKRLLESAEMFYSAAQELGKPTTTPPEPQVAQNSRPYRPSRPERFDDRPYRQFRGI